MAEAKDNPQQAANPPVVAKPTYKKLTWTLKVEGDAFKVPEIKSSPGIDVAGSFDVEVTVAKANQYIATESVVDIQAQVTQGPLIALVIKLDPATPKEMKALRVNSVSQDDPAPVDRYKELGMDSSKNTLVYFTQIPGFKIPRAGKLYFVNENPYDVKVLISLAYGPKPN